MTTTTAVTRSEGDVHQEKHLRAGEVVVLKGHQNYFRFSDHLLDMEFAFQDEVEDRGELKEAVYSVAELIAAVNRDLESDYALVRVRGEVGDITIARSGHVYFTLKDEEKDAALSAVMFKASYMRRSFDLTTGRRIIAWGGLTIYPQRGAFQIVVRGFSDAGEGLLALQLEALKRKLMQEGLTDPARKRPLPRLPSKIGIVTSLEGAALQDMLRVLAHRVAVHVVISPSAVQGDEAPASLIRALQRLGEVEGVEVVIIGRGGGSAEDLAAFNDEALARAIAAFPVPVISAVGHEVDWTISDLVADVRAPTPTAAAQLVIPTREELEGALRRLETNLSRCLEGYVLRARDRLHRLRGRLVSPERLVMNRRQRMDELHSMMLQAVYGRLQRARLVMERLSVSLHHLHPGVRLRHQRELLEAKVALLKQAARRRLRGARESYVVAASRLEALSPLGVLARGYAIASRKRDGALVKSPREVEDGEMLDLRVHQGLIPCQVKKMG